MDDVARWPAADRADLFVVTGTGRWLTAEMIEKDFWVCWVLKRLFTLPDLPAGLLFKGGTSLSKVFGIIERFSEDVDLSFARAGLGFAGENDPLTATGKRRKRGLEALTETCQRVVREQLLPQLTAVFVPPKARWPELERDYRKMQEMIFGEPPAFERLLEVLREIEQAVNLPNGG